MSIKRSLFLTDFVARTMTRRFTIGPIKSSTVSLRPAIWTDIPSTVTSSQSLSRCAATRNGALESMSWQEFELLVGEFFRRRGFTVSETGGGGADSGVDLVIAQGNDRYVVQCKQWRARQVGVSVVRELYGVMTAKGAVGGFVVTSGAFTDDAWRFAEGREIELVACDQLLAMVREQHSQRSPAKAAKPTAATAPSCPQCNSPMVLRTARRGAQAGSSFWGCPKYPACRGTRPV